MRILIVSNLYAPRFIGGYEILCTQVVASLVRRGHSVMVLTSDCVPPTELLSPAAKAATPNDTSDPVLSEKAKSPSPALPSAPPDPSRIETGAGGESIVRSLHLHLPFGEPASLDRLGRQKVERRNRAATAQVINSFKPDIAFVWSQLRLGLAAARKAEASGLPVVYTMNDDHILGYKPGSTSGLKGALRFLLEHVIVPASTYHDLRFETVISISDTLRQRLAAADPRFSRAVLAFQGVPIDKYPVKSEPGSASDPFRILYSGQLHSYKGVHTIIEAVGILTREAAADSGHDSARRIRYSLSVAGMGNPDYEASLRARAAELGIDARFLGRVPNATIAPLYRESDLLVFSSIWDEPFGLSHLEAMASGTPVVSVGHGGPGEFLRDGENALIFLKEDATGLARAIARIAGDDELRRRLALAGRATVESRFTLERYTDRLEAILEGVLTDHGAAGGARA